MRFELTTSSLPRKRSTPELRRQLLKKNHKPNPVLWFFERKTRVELATFSLEGWRSTNWATSAFLFVGKRFANLQNFLKSSFIKCGESRIRTYEAEATELQSVPFSHSGISPNFFKRASRGIRTHDPEITNHVLWPTELWRQIDFKRTIFLRCGYFRFASANMRHFFETYKYFYKKISIIFLCQLFFLD